MAQRYVVPVEIEKIAQHLWWWTATHPDWGPQDFEAGQGWEREVSCYALVEDGELVIFDPLVPPEDEERFWRALDDDVEHHGPPTILLTIYWHARSAQAIADRYEGASVRVDERSVEPFRERVCVTSTFGDGERLAGGVEAIAMHHRDEAAFWLASHSAVVFGDSVLGYPDCVRLCPESWLGEGESAAELRATAERALARRPRVLLLTHGGPRQSSEARL